MDRGRAHQLGCCSVLWPLILQSLVVIFYNMGVSYNTWGRKSCLVRALPKLFSPVVSYRDIEAGKLENVWKRPTEEWLWRQQPPESQVSHDKHVDESVECSFLIALSLQIHMSSKRLIIMHWKVLNNKDGANYLAYCQIKKNHSLFSLLTDNNKIDENSLIYIQKLIEKVKWSWRI